MIERLNKLFNKIIVDDVPVSEVYRAQNTIRFMEELFGDKPKISKKKVLVSSRGTSKKRKAKRSLPKSNSRNFLIPASCVLEIYEPKINNIYHELKSLHLDDGTNALGVLFRVFLETSLDYYANKFGLQFEKKLKLSGKIVKITEDLKKKGFTKSQLKNIRSVTRKGYAILSIDYFHEYVHSFKTNPSPIDLIYKWENLQEFFEILWEEIKKREKKKRK